MKRGIGVTAAVIALAGCGGTVGGGSTTAIAPNDATGTKTSTKAGGRTPADILRTEAQRCRACRRIERDTVDAPALKPQPKAKPKPKQQSGPPAWMHGRARRVWEGGEVECRGDRQVYRWSFTRAVASIRAEREAQWVKVAQAGCAATYR